MVRLTKTLHLAAALLLVGSCTSTTGGSAAGAGGGAVAGGGGIPAAGGRSGIGDGSGGAAGGAGGIPPSGGASGVGGTTATGGVSAAGGATANGGGSGAGGTTATGGVSGVGGVTPAGGGSGRGGTTGGGGVTGAGGTSAAGGVSGAGGVTAATAGRARVVVMTDVSNEPDDAESLVRFLAYSNEFDVEAMVAVTSQFLKTGPREDLIRADIDAYAQVRPNLLKHAHGFPDPALLGAVTKTGQTGFGMAVVGPGKATPGSQQLIDAADKADPRPIWMTIWGGSALARRPG